MKTQNPANWYRQIKLLTNGPQDQAPINTPGLSADDIDNFKQVANHINDYFLQIASGLPKLDNKYVTSMFTVTYQVSNNWTS